MDLAAIKSRLAGSNGRLYWRSLGQLADTPDFRDYLHREFPDQASEWNDPKGRRDFLKLMSASLALAGVGACTKQPPESIVPYVRQPEDIVPGRPLYFASAIPFSGTAMPVLVESHMGRPTKIEGNPEHPASLGGADVLTQASVLNLYDPDRLQTTSFRGELQGWPRFVGAMQEALRNQKTRGGAGLHFLTPPMTSPSLASLLGEVLRDYPAAKWHQYRCGRPAGRRPVGSRPGLPVRQGGRGRRAGLRLSDVRSRQRPVLEGLCGTAPAHRGEHLDEPPVRHREHPDAHRRQGRSSVVGRGLRGRRHRARAGGGDYRLGGAGAVCGWPHGRARCRPVGGRDRQGSSGPQGPLGGRRRRLPDRRRPRRRQGHQ